MSGEESDSKDLGRQAYERAYELELKVGCCPQCVLTAVDETVGGVSEDTIKASHGLSGGGALTGQGACGALTGGLLALSTRKGRDADKLDRGRGMANFNVGKDLTRRFEEEFGGITCEDLQQQFSGQTWDLWKPEEYKGFSDARDDRCARATATVTQWVVEMIDGKKG
ncbi:C-GCAxxG-C-C family protein [Magnetospira sp. QH-2]|uniref:C-GCAxxG-C-C family protein n=1 Tax=Magnetospira sp. (strain QH-2) TaxID=1288970 RepID=UPI0003E80CAC|nr:C-GCAxxG-C-C family protein [Magnetospira sp. QH-2]CCQ74376.1 putative C_GCAxxG_C_C family protein [Magnetospira sp. QH-2]